MVAYAIMGWPTLGLDAPITASTLATRRVVRPNLVNQQSTRPGPRRRAADDLCDAPRNFSTPLRWEGETYAMPQGTSARGLRINAPSKRPLPKPHNSNLRLGAMLSMPHLGCSWLESSCQEPAASHARRQSISFEGIPGGPHRTTATA
jgi:hypothetical protein